MVSHRQQNLIFLNMSPSSSSQKNSHHSKNIHICMREEEEQEDNISARCGCEIN